MNRRKTKQLWVGGIPIGGDAPIVIQSMTNTNTADVQQTLKQISRLAEVGCQIARVTVPDTESVIALKKIVKASTLPVIADIHFDYQLALKSIESGVAGLRLNPGNIGGMEKVKAVAKLALEHQVPIRVGVNSGSLEKEFLTKHGGITPLAMVESAMRQVEILEAQGFDLIKISLKASNVPLMLEAYTELAKRTNYPFHIGVTEAGTPKRGSIKSAVGIGALLAAGLGDTIRVSLAGEPVEEIFVAKEILRSLGLYHQGADYIVCPTCGRTKIDLLKIAQEVETRVEQMNLIKPIKIAIMGCVVNGPGEAREADVGIAGGVEQGLVFARGQVVGKYPAEDLVAQLLKLVEQFVAQS